MAYDTFAAFIGTYTSADAAISDYEGVKALYYGLDLMDTFDAAVIAKETDGKVKIVKKHEEPTRQGGWAGAGLGLATGLVVALFPAVAIGAGVLVGTSAGAVIGAVAGHVVGGLSRGDLKDIGEQLDDGQAALIVIAALDLEARVEEALRAADTLEKKQLKADTEAIEAEAKVAKDTAGKDPETTD